MTKFPDIRLEASWYYAEVEELIGMGSGGGSQFQISNDKLQIEKLEVTSDELRKSEITKLNELNEHISNDPVMSKLKKSFDKTSKEKSEKVEKQIRELSEKKNSENAVSENKQVQTLERNREIDKNKEDRAKRNIFESVHLSKEEKQKRRIEDLSFTTILSRNDSENKDMTNIPFEYKLSQNYPNPFNPGTTINFSIPKQGNVTLKVYDVTGKEVIILINEQRSAGNYTVSFDGANLPSGTYFYRLESGEFKEVKRMILVK